MRSIKRSKYYSLLFKDGQQTDTKRQLAWIAKFATSLTKNVDTLTKDDTLICVLNHHVFVVVYVGFGKRAYAKFTKKIAEIEKEEAKVRRPKKEKFVGQILYIPNPQSAFVNIRLDEFKV